MVGGVRANQLRDRTLQTYVQAADHALTKGIIIADTKFEFGVDTHGNLVLADEVFTRIRRGTGPPLNTGSAKSRTASINNSSAIG